MARRAPAAGPTPWSFDRAACSADLDAFEALLSSKAELSERRVVLRFFTEHPNLSAFPGSYHPNATAYDRLGVEVELFGQFTADVIAGDKTSQAYALVEFEDGGANSMFVQARFGQVAPVVETKLVGMQSKDALDAFLRRAAVAPTEDELLRPFEALS